eukprot:jgi/Mesen1/147/ME1130469C07677
MDDEYCPIHVRSRIVWSTDSEDDDSEDDDSEDEGVAWGSREDGEEQEEDEEDEDEESLHEEDSDEVSWEDDQEDDGASSKDAPDGDEALACVYMRYHDPTKQILTAGYACVGDNKAAVMIPYEPSIEELAVSAISEEL